MWHDDEKETTNKCANEHSLELSADWWKEEMLLLFIIGAIRVAITRIWMNGRFAEL